MHPPQRCTQCTPLVCQLSNNHFCYVSLVSLLKSKSFRRKSRNQYLIFSQQKKTAEIVTFLEILKKICARFLVNICKYICLFPSNCPRLSRLFSKSWPILQHYYSLHIITLLVIIVFIIITFVFFFSI